MLVFPFAVKHTLVSRRSVNIVESSVIDALDHLGVDVRATSETTLVFVRVGLRSLDSKFTFAHHHDVVDSAVLAAALSAMVADRSLEHHPDLLDGGQPAFEGCIG